MSPGFPEWQQEIFALHGQGQALEALGMLANPPTDLTAGQRDSASFWAACLHAGLGHTDAALGALEEVEGRGRWLAPARLERDPDLSPIRGQARFGALLARWQARLQAEGAQVTPELRVLEASGRARPAPLPGTLIALHMNLNSAARTRPLFEDLSARGWRVAVAQRGQLGGPEAFVWDNAAQAGEEARAWALELGGAPIWVGLSAGGHVALRGVLTGTLPASGVLAVVPSVPAEPAWWPAQPLPVALARVPVAFVLGERDPLTPGTRALAGRLRDAGVPVAEWTHAGGHDLPPHWTGVRDDALDWLTQWAFALAFDPALPELPEPLRLGDSPQEAEKLLARVLTGQKTAMTEWPTEWYGEGRAGQLFTLLDGQGQPGAIIRIVRGRAVPFLEVGDDHIAAEGEGYATAAEWRAAHRAFFASQTHPPRPFTDSERVVCEEVEVVWPFPTVRSG